MRQRRNLTAYLAAWNVYEALRANSAIAEDIPDYEALCKAAKFAESLAYRNLTGGEIGAARRIIAAEKCGKRENALSHWDEGGEA